jgi:uncharacterized protein (TIRG00374 family)
MKKRKLLILLALGFFFLFLWLKIIDIPLLFSYFKNVSIPQGIYFSFFYLLAYFFRSLRWRLILLPIKKLSVLHAVGIYMIGLFFNYLVPIRAGEVAKAALLKSRYQIKISNSLPTIFLDKLFDLMPILLILLFIPILAIQLTAFLYFVIGLLLVIWLLFLLFLFFSIYHQDKANSLLQKLLPLFPMKFRSKMNDFFHHFVLGLSILRGKPIITFAILFLTLCAVFSEAYFVHALFSLFGAKISLPYIIFGYTLMNLTYILPTPPAQIGSNQFMWTVIFSFVLGVNENLTGAVVTFSHLLTAFLIISIGIFSFLGLHVSYQDILKFNK